MVGLGFAGHVLQVDHFRQGRMGKDVVASPGALKGKTKAGYQTDHIRKSNIPEIALSKFFEQLSAIHQLSRGAFLPCC